MTQPLATLEEDECKAEIYEAEMPGQFMIHYIGQDGTLLAEEPLTGVSSYRQREVEIRSRLRDLRDGKKPEGSALSDSGEY